MSMQATVQSPTETSPGSQVRAYLDTLETFQRQHPARSAVVKQLRAAGAEQFARLGFPGLRQEAWRYTNVAPIAGGGFAPATETSSQAADAEAGALLAPYRFDGGCHLAFVDGRFSAEHSQLAELPAGVVACSLAEALERMPEKVEAYLGRHARIDEHPFVALNGAFLSDGGFVYVPRGVLVERPIHLLFLAASPRVAAYPRCLVVAAEGSQCTVVETYLSREHEEGTFTCPVTEVVLGPSTLVDHYKVQRESTRAFHVATQQSYLERNATFRSHSISLGGRLVRNDVNSVLDGEGVDCTLNGLYLVAGRQQVDNHMRVDHARPHGNSHELYKGILDGHGRAVFNGLIHVHPDAQKTDAKQTNRNLLLSPGALANSNPQLEIFADDVRCTHGSTVGQLDEDAVFYLRSRGISADAARSLLTYAFASELVEKIKVEAVRRDLEESLFHRLPGGEVVRQAV